MIKAWEKKTKEFHDIEGGGCLIKVGEATRLDGKGEN